jgi:hypothetical protein
MREQLSKFMMGLFTMLLVAGGIAAAFMYGGGRAIAPGGKQERPALFIPDDRGRDTGRVYATPAPQNSAPLNMETAEAFSLSVYKTAVAKAALPNPVVPAPAPELPDCASGKLPCQFVYSSGPARPAPQLATGGVNTGSDGHPQKDTDQAADPWGGDKP